MIYFDNSATSFYKPESVITSVTDALTNLSANPGRSGHSMAVKAAMAVSRARTALTEFVGQRESDNCIFTLNCSQALNLAIMGSLQKGAHVITSALEHNSVLRPLHYLRSTGAITVTTLAPSALGTVDADAVSRALTRNTALVVLTHASNVTGVVQPVAEVGALCRSKGIRFLVDGAQSVGHVGIQMLRDNIDMLAVSPHKGLHAPQGVGALIIGDRARLSPILFGGTGTDSVNLRQPDTIPEGFEAGTVATPAICGLTAAVGYTAAHMAEDNEKIAQLQAMLHEGLSKNQKITLYTPKSAYIGVVSFNILGMTSSDTSNLLDSQYDICVRGGLHCAPLAHSYLGTLGTGAVRVSLAADNTSDQIEFFLNAVSELSAE